MTNIRCKGNKEIDLLAINPNTKIKYHVESRVATTFKLRLKATYTKKGTCHRNGVDFFAEKKFNHPYIVEKTHEIFGDTNYEKWLVVWDVQNNSVMKMAKQKFDIEIVTISYLIQRMIFTLGKKGSRDDILRIIELVALSPRRRGEAIKPYLRRLRQGEDINP